MFENKIIVISGPTASGKSYLAIELAKKINGIILNADSMQVYTDLPILSAQPSKNDLEKIEHRLYSYLTPYESNSVYIWLEMIKKNVEEIIINKKIPIIVGGTGMYISRLINGIKELPNVNINLRNKLNKLYEDIGWDKFYKIVENIDKESILKLKKNDKQRLIRIYEIFETSGTKLSTLENMPNNILFKREDIIHINLLPNRDILYERCEIRFANMLQEAIDEVKNFILKYSDIFNIKNSILNTIGLIEIKNYLENKISYEEMFYLSVKKTKNYAKRQYTWFKNQFKNLDFLIKEIPNKENINLLINFIIK